MPKDSFGTLSRFSKAGTPRVILTNAHQRSAMDSKFATVVMSICNFLFLKFLTHFFSSYMKVSLMQWCSGVISGLGAKPLVRQKLVYLRVSVVDSRQISLKAGPMLQILDLSSIVRLAGCER